MSSEKRPLDLNALVTTVAPLRVTLAVSAAIGVILGLAVTTATAFVVVFMTPLGLPALIFATVSVSVASLQWLAAGLAAIVLIPVGAAIATSIRLRNIEGFILVDCAAKPPAPDSRFGEVMSAIAHLAGLPEVPRYGVIDDVFNAFAMSSRHEVGFVLMGSKLIDKLDVPETIAVLGHEIGHVAMRDSERKYLAIGHQEYLTSFLVFAGLRRIARVLFGFVAEFALSAHSREREYWADAVGAYIAGPEAMISALRKIEAGGSSHRIERRYSALMFRPVRQLFATHPPTAARIAALEERTYLDRLPVQRAREITPEAATARPATFSGM